MTVLFIGLGTMGEPMARNLHGYAGDSLTVFDVRPDVTEKLARDLSVSGLSSLASVPESVDTAVLMLPNSAIVESILQGADGLLARLAAGSLVIDMSSSEPESSKTLAAAAEQRGIDYLDAPVSGGQRKAVTGELSIMVGGTQQAFDRAEPLLQSMGAAVHHVGPAGSGDAAKALNNLLSATNIAAAAEVITAAAKFGIAPETMVTVLNASTGRSQASEVKYPNHILTGTYDSGFAYDLMLKDLRIARSLTGEITTPVTDRALAVAEENRPLLGEHPDHTELARYYETHTSIQISNTRDDERTQK